MLAVWQRTLICAVVEFCVRVLFVKLPTWLPPHVAVYGPIIASLPFSGVLISYATISNCIDKYGAYYTSVVGRLFGTVIFMEPINVLGSWLLLELTAGARRKNISLSSSYGIGMLIVLSLWFGSALTAYGAILYVTRVWLQMRMYYSYTLVYTFAGFAGALLIVFGEPARLVARVVSHSEEGRKSYINWLVPFVAVLVIVLISLVGSAGGAGGEAFTGLLASVPLGMWFAFTYLWFQKADTLDTRVNVCRSVLWPATVGYRSFPLFYLILPGSVAMLGADHWGWAICASFLFSSVAVLVLAFSIFGWPASEAAEVAANAVAHRPHAPPRKTFVRL